MKWLLILFFGIIVVPALAQTSQINQTDYQKLENSISELQIKLQQLNTSINRLQMDHQKLENSVNEVHTEYQNLGGSINETRSELRNDYTWSDLHSAEFAIIPFVGGVIIAVILYLRQKKETSEIGKITEEIHNMVTKENKLIDDTRNAYASAFVEWVHLVIFSFDGVIDLYNDLYLGKPISEKRENTRRNLIDHYNRDLVINFPKIEMAELIKIFGKEIANKVWLSRTHLNAEMWQPYDDKGMSLMMADYDKYVKKAIELKDTLLQFCDADLKAKDAEYADTYKKIKEKN